MRRVLLLLIAFMAAVFGVTIEKKRRHHLRSSALMSTLSRAGAEGPLTVDYQEKSKTFLTESKAGNVIYPGVGAKIQGASTKDFKFMTGGLLHLGEAMSVRRDEIDYVGLLFAQSDINDELTFLSTAYASTASAAGELAALRASTASLQIGERAAGVIFHTTKAKAGAHFFIAVNNGLDAKKDSMM